MGGSLLLLALSVLLQSLLAESSINCFSDFSTDGTGLESNKRCQISYNLNKTDGCLLMVNPPRLSAPGRKAVKKSMGASSNLIALERCRLDGDRIVCNCDTDYCNKNFYAHWPAVLDVLLDVSDECRQIMTDRAYTILHPLVDTVNPGTGKIFEPVKVEPMIDCAVTGSETTAKGYYCTVEIPRIDGTCYNSGEPLFSAGLDEEEQVCSSSKTIKINCYTNNCNADKDIIKQQIENGIDVHGSKLNPECKVQLLQSVDKLQGFGQRNPCGPGGSIGINQACECKAGWVDIITMKDLPEGHNHTKGQLCVPENACVLQGEKHVIMFILDASGATHHNQSTFIGMQGFVLNVENLIDKSSNEVVFVAYGGSDTKVGTLNSGWTSKQFKEEVNRVLADHVGSDTNIADGFDRAKSTIESYDRSKKRVVIHIGDGMPTGDRRDQAQPSYNKLAAVVDRFISVAVAREDNNMKVNWHTPDDYVDFIQVGYANLNLDNMKFLMQKVCPQQPYDELIKNSLKLTK